MKDRKEDRRVIRTKQVILEALVTLIEEKGIDAVTVKDITRKANINRGTFYLHYQDKTDLLEKTVGDIMEECQALLLQSNSLVIKEYVNSNNPPLFMVSLFEYFDQNASLIRAFLSMKGDLSFQEQFKNIIWSNLFEKELSVHIKKDNLLVPGDYLVIYLISAHLGVIQHWLEKEQRETPREMASILYHLSFRGPLYAAGVNTLS
ncbi:MAG: TetR/AcrR family transcriptional regulator [Syntrophomonadaceae bacterium]|jgi:AcrR family transcriptional regulator|nr:TetR/AcrR family transcriptional regulator [Syntrophomonadaceae bacterium]